jgi:hypothetical protein
MSCSGTIKKLLGLGIQWEQVSDKSKTKSINQTFQYVASNGFKKGLFPRQLDYSLTNEEQYPPPFRIKCDPELRNKKLGDFFFVSTNFNKQCEMKILVDFYEITILISAPTSIRDETIYLSLDYLKTFLEEWIIKNKQHILESLTEEPSEIEQEED